VVFTALIPIAAGGVRSSIWEYFSGQVNWDIDFGLDDLRPDFMATVLTLWSVALLAEQGRVPRRNWYLLSAVFAAAAILVKQSTSPLVLAAWAAVLIVTWFAQGHGMSATRAATWACGLLALLLAPWTILGHGATNVLRYLYTTEVTFKGTYGTSESFPQRLTYFPSLLPGQLGQVEAWIVVGGSALVVLALVRRRVSWTEAVYGIVAVAFYLAFSFPTSRNSHLGIWISLGLWVFFWAGVTSIVANRWQALPSRVSAGALAAVALYVAAIYSLASFAVVSWPRNELEADAQLSRVTESLAGELSQHLSADQCFTYAPGPGWPASIEFAVSARKGSSPMSTATEVDPTVTSVSDYVTSARRCDAFVVYEQGIGEVAQAFYAPSAYQPYFQAVADWARGPGSGLMLDRSWTFSDLPPIAPHTLGRYTGRSLTVDLWLRALN
jgi:hypothetical protein